MRLLNGKDYKPFETKDDDSRTNPLWFTAIDALILVLGLIAFLALISWAQDKDEVERVAYSQLLAECFNGGTLYDYNTRTAYFCSKPLEVKL